jgi:RNA polymerase sigma-70 factor, ECF subfamily
MMTSLQSNLSSDPDSRLVLEAQQHPASFQALYDRWVTPAYQYFYYRTGEKSNAEDLTSQLFLSVYQALPRYQHSGRFAAWLFTIARNLFREYYRKKRREVPLEMARHVESPSNPAAEFAHADEIQRLAGLVRSLPEGEQELIRLRYVAGLGFADMAAVLNKREQAVKKALYRLQARLQSLLEQKNE